MTDTVEQTTVAADTSTKPKKEAKLRTSITVSPGVLETLRQHCERKDISVSSYLEELVKADLYKVDASE